MTAPIVPGAPETQTPGLTAQDPLAELREANRRLMEEIGSIRTQIQSATQQFQQRPEPPPPPPSPEDFQNDPYGVMRRVVGELVAPIAQQVAATQRYQMIDQVVAQCKNDPRFSDVSQFESAFRNTLSSLPNFSVEAVQYAYYLAKGQHVSLNPQAIARQPVAPNSGRLPEVIPAHLIPTPALPEPGNNGLPKLRPLNELEQRLAREQRMSVHKFLFRLGEISREQFEAYEQAAKGGK